MIDTDQESLLEETRGAESQADQSSDGDWSESGINDFGPPFDDADADVILRSSDHTDFRVYQIILVKASPFFRDMFSLPQPNAESPDSERDGVPVIHVEEETTTLAALLRLCYPVQDTFMWFYLNFSMMGSILRAARKYDMQSAYDTANRMFVQSPLFKSYPAHAFGVAWRCRLEREVHAAARECLHGKMSLESLGHDLKLIEGKGLFELFSYHRKCGKVASSLAINFAWIKRRNGSVWDWASTEMWNQYVWVECQCAGSAIQVSDQSEEWHVRSWWSKYMERSRAALIDVPSGKSVTALSLLTSVILDASSCDYCQKRAPEALIDFSQIFAQEVERRVSQVKLKITF